MKHIKTWQERLNEDTSSTDSNSQLIRALEAEVVELRAYIKSIGTEENAISRVLFGPPYKQKLF